MTLKSDSESWNSATPSEELISLVYRDLKPIALAKLACERRDISLTATDLVHQAYARLHSSQDLLSGKPAYMVAAALAMKRILIEHARARHAQSRGGGRRPMPLTDNVAVADASGKDKLSALQVAEALDCLEKVDPQGHRVVLLRFYSGLTEAETAAAMGISVKRTRRAWNCARAWIKEWIEHRKER